MVCRDIVNKADTTEEWEAQGAPTHRGAPPMHCAAGRALHKGSSSRAPSPARAAGQAVGGGAYCSDTGALTSAFSEIYIPAFVTQFLGLQQLMAGMPEPPMGMPVCMLDVSEPEQACVCLQRQCCRGGRCSEAGRALRLRHRTRAAAAGSLIWTIRRTSEGTGSATTQREQGTAQCASGPGR